MKLYFLRNTDTAEKESTSDLLKKCFLQYIKNTSHGSCDSFCGEVLYTDNGKPYFSKSNIRVSVSHSENIWLCVMSDKTAGVDIEKIKDVKVRKISERFFTEEECKYIRSGKTGEAEIMCENSDSDRNKARVKAERERFFEIWTAKEAYGKYHGIGISSGMMELDTVTDAKEKKAVFRRIKVADGFICTVCTEEPEEIEIVELK